MDGRIFISYASADCLTAKKLRWYLIKHGKHVLLAPRNLKQGRDYQEKLSGDILNWEAVIFLFSSFSNYSEYVKCELEHACKRKIPVIMIRISKEELRQEIAGYMGRTVWVPGIRKGRPKFFLILWTLSQLSIKSKRDVIKGETENKETAKKEIQTKETEKKQTENRDFVKILVPVALGMAGILLLLSLTVKDRKQKQAADDNKMMGVQAKTVWNESEDIKERENSNEREESIEGIKAIEEVGSKKGAESKEGREGIKVWQGQEAYASIFSAFGNMILEQAEKTAMLRNSQMTYLHEGELDLTRNTDFGRSENLRYKTSELVNVGDIMQFGQYYPRGYQKKNKDAKLTWIVLDKSEDGKSFLLLAEHIIDIMPFDVAESGYFNLDKEQNPYDILKAGDYTDRQMAEFKGNSDWEYSNIRAYLNSAEEYVIYQDQMPGASGTDEGCNGYEKEQGFLYWFKEEDRERILKTTVSTAVNSLSHGKNIKGEIWFDYFPGTLHSFKLSKVKKKETEDQVFLLSLEELMHYYKKIPILYTTPTKSAIGSDQSSWYKSYKQAGIENYLWALRTPDGTKSYSICAVTGDPDANEIFIQNAAAAGLGIRPAMWVSVKETKFQGQGTEKSPYVLVPEQE